MMSALYQTNTVTWIFIILKQQFAGRHVDPLGHIILIRSQPVFALSLHNVACLAKKQQIPIL